jgi:multidrug efflux pump subunit AcrA (membrane-fusion protein)
MALAAEEGGGEFPEYRAVIKAQNDVQIPAEVEGVLKKLPVREGSRVRAGELLAQLDDRRARAAVEVARLSHEAARKRADDDIEGRYAQKAAGVAYIDWLRDVEANRSKANAVPEIQIRQKRLVFQRSELQIEKAEKDQVLAGKEADVKLAEQQAAEIGVAQRTILAPFDGEVQTLFKHEAEWVSPGDPILRLVQYDVLHVECFVSSARFDPVDLQSCDTLLRVTLARGREVELPGKVIYVSQVVQGDGKYLVRAEVQNQRDGAYWLVRPGLPAEIVLQVPGK